MPTAAGHDIRFIRDTRDVIEAIVAMGNGREWDRIDELFAEGVIVHAPLEPAPQRGRRAIRDLYARQATAVPDLHARVVEMAVEGDRAAVRSVLNGTHRGFLGGFPPSGRRFDGVDDARWYRVADGQVAEVWILPTTAQMLERLRLIPSGPPPKPLQLLMRLKNKAAATDLTGPPYEPAATAVDLIPDEHGAASKYLIRRGQIEFFNQRRFGLYNELFGPDYRITSKVDNVTGKTASLRLYRKVLTSFPDLSFVIEDLVCDGETVAELVTASGTNLGPLEGFPPTGKRYEATEIFFWTVRDGRIRRQWHFVNFESMLQQIGVMPEGAPPAPMRLLLKLLASRG